MKIRIGVVFGGESVEHEVSIISAIQAMNKMDGEKYQIVPIYITKDRNWYTGEALKDIETFQDMDLIKRYCKNVILYEKDGHFLLQNKKGLLRSIVAEIDMVFPIVHGTNVEDGVLQGYFQSIGIPFVGVDVDSAVVGQNKIYMKQIFEQEKIPVAPYVWFYDVEYQEGQNDIIERIEKLKYPVIVKPCNLGSSVGIAVAHNQEELVDAIDSAITYDNRIVVEKVIQNLMEVNISVLGNYENQQISAIEEVTPKDDFLTYADKYIGNGKSKGKISTKYKGTSKGMVSASRVIPAPLEEKLKKEVEDIAIHAFKVLKSSGVVRMDFLVDKKENKVYINEVNNIPGSLSFYLWSPVGKDYSELLDDMINIGIKDYKKRVAKVHSFDTNILKGFAEMGGTKGMKGVKKIR